MAPRTQNPAVRSSSSNGRPPSPRANVDIDPRWILKALGVVVLAALICGYLTLCLIFYVGQWQIVLHPTRSTKAVVIVGAAPELVRFGPDESATPQLTGWWIPAAPGAKYADTTLLYLPSGDGSLVDASGSLEALHSLGINVFAIDYRGYGQSSTTHPSQVNMTGDADAAFQYLRTSRGLLEQQIVPYGVGVGASLAAGIASRHSGVAAVVLESPLGDLLATLVQDARTNMLPARLLFHERFPLATPLAMLHTPKLLMGRQTQIEALKTASGPKIVVTLGGKDGAVLSQTDYLPFMSRFLDQYLASAPASLKQTAK